jgi:hypothetical protein
VNTSDYLSYLSQNLGLEHVILPKRHTELGFYIVGDTDSPSAEEQELFEKMVMAMKIPRGVIEVITCRSLPSDFFAPLSVVLTLLVPEKEYGVWTTVGESQVLYTYSLKSLLENTQLKKACWAHLQIVMEKKKNLH